MADRVGGQQTLTNTDKESEKEARQSRGLDSLSPQYFKYVEILMEKDETVS